MRSYCSLPARQKSNFSLNLLSTSLQTQHNISFTALCKCSNHSEQKIWWWVYKSINFASKDSNYRGLLEKYDF